ncbi:hypothetical protein OAT16_02675 [Prolixibacteraceae bacterium]|nr:hypothetical protein [Prolixibacteraceae bacterium]
MKLRTRLFVCVILVSLILLFGNLGALGQEVNLGASTAVKPDSTVTLVLEAGTMIPIRISSLLVASAIQPGSKFAGVVSMDIITADGSILPQNSKAQGVILSAKKGGRLAGSAEIVLKLTHIQYKNMYYPIETFTLVLSSENAGKETVRKAGAGAAIGAVFNGGKGAGRGAAVMGGLQLLTNNGDMKVPVGYVLNFKLEKRTKF